ncbi:C-CAP/cofactor C-like domain-containing protein [Actinidia rufa]|uniref:C-CAP/cofactor C-like domain-containing protein n=1 Tax=Actinidia rufa TaxID=165716 RepID=A0A7J0F6I2_9ERIC|nr:C-CAP/cofactor C-like domain-containing protein [Actinidia rufa]
MEEEPEDLPKPNQASEKTLDAASRKHAAMLERLANRKQSLSSQARRREFLLLAFIRGSYLPQNDLRPQTNRRKRHFRNRPQEKVRIQEQKASTGVVPEIEPEIQAFEQEKPSYPIHPIRELPGFREKENEVLVKEFEGSEIGEFTISDLNFCEVRLKGCLRALFVHRLRNCKVYVGSVFGSVLIEEVEGCVFVLASHQIRIHHARESDFYLRARSRPIIEDCNGVRFAPYCLSYDGIERDLREANLEEETGNWANVDDFRWLRAVQSPNWSVLPENERVGGLTISNLDE